MANYLVRPITPDDYLSVRRIDELTQIQYLGQQKWDELTLEEKEARLASRQPNFSGFAKSGYSLLVELEGNVIGFILAHETVPTYQEVYCEYVAISPAWQGNRVGVLLHKNLIAIAKKNNIKKVWGLVNLDNPNSMKAFMKAGFKLGDRKEAVFAISKL